DHRHFGRAAESCAVTQSTLSASIKVLEELLQATLVDRSRRRVALTPLGLETVERARRIIAECEALAHAAREAPSALQTCMSRHARVRTTRGPKSSEPMRGDQEPSGRSSNRSSERPVTW